jgi:hypothetical protein
MGDGQHGWAAAEWVMMLRSLFVREEGDGLIIGSGIFPEWLRGDHPLHFGPTPTPFGSVEVRLEKKAKRWFLSVEGDWRNGPPSMEARIPGFAALFLEKREKNQELKPL